MQYAEEYSEFLEQEFEKTIKTNNFHKRIDFIRSLVVTRYSDSAQEEHFCEEAFVFHSNRIMLHFTQATMLDEYGNFYLMFS